MNILSDDEVAVAHLPFAKAEVDVSLSKTVMSLLFEVVPSLEPLLGQ